MSVREPQILSQHSDGASVMLLLQLPPDLEFFHGHFDEQPLLPGVTQVHWAITHARRAFSFQASFQRLSALKFMRVLTPGVRTALHLDWDAGASVLTFRYGEAAAPYSSGRVHFGPAA